MGHARKLQTIFGGSLASCISSLPSIGPRNSRLLLIRHGESSGNSLQLLSGGGTDHLLTAQGFRQVNALASELKSIGSLNVCVVLSSPLARARDSADCIAQLFPAARRIIVEELREMNYGSLEGAQMKNVAVQREMGKISDCWRAGETSHRVGGHGESLDDVAKRGSEIITRLLAGLPGKTVVAVAHSHLIKCVLAHAIPGLGLARLHELKQRNCAVNVIDFYAAHQDLVVMGVNLRCGMEDMLEPRQPAYQCSHDSGPSHHRM